MAGLVLLALVGAVVLRRQPPPVQPAGAPLAERLASTRQTAGARLAALFRRLRLDDTFWTDLEETLLAADLGAATVDRVMGRVKERHPADPGQAREAVRAELRSMFLESKRSLQQAGRPAVIVVVGVNGVGKTTSIAKLAARLKEQGLQPLLGCADTFRAAADLQLRGWAERASLEVVSGQGGADPAAVAFDAYQAARSRGRDAVII
ncbi:MAG: signal recognition particle receptor subunit alpha, partial [Actinomycetota bacterium]|nr:signal recognition particle receptor subunit alpha [Actinomycetota bacterium]